MQQGDGDSQQRGIQVQRISVPNGGGAITGSGELFAPDEFTGAAGLTIPLPTPSARDFEPELSLTYSSGSGNGPFGLGFDVALPSVKRRTGRGVPQYETDDAFVVTGYGEVVVVEGSRRDVTVDGVAYDVTTYIPRLESTFDLIEQWVSRATRESLWRIVDRRNVTTILGRTGASQIADPSDSTRVFAWLLDVSFDALGNAMEVEYLAENDDRVPDVIYERDRVQTANRYPAAVRFGNATPFSQTPYGLGAATDPRWHFEIVFDYGQYDTSPSNDAPYTPIRQWPARSDPFSSYSAGFEVRTHRLCRNVLVFHRFGELGPDPVLTQVSRLTYDENSLASRLVRFDTVGYAYDATKPPGSRYATTPVPPLELRYVEFAPLAHEFEPVVDLDDRPLSGVAQPPDITLVDLCGEGAPGILYSDGTSTLYRPPETSDTEAARFGAPGELREFPIPRRAGGPNLQLIDLDGNGRLDLVVSEPVGSGFYQNRSESDWNSFRPFPAWPADLGARSLSFADLSGTGRSDVVDISRNEIRYYPSSGLDGFGPAVVRRNEHGVPSPGGASPMSLVTFGDVLGAGLVQVVRVSDGVVECWPSLGHGTFAPKVVLAGAPRFGPTFDPARLFLADLDGTGASDIVYVDGPVARVWLNRGGNGYAEPFEMHLPVDVTSAAQVTVADLGGTGVPSLVVMDAAPQNGTWSYNFAGGRKPYLLSGLRNNLGADTAIEYASSTAFYLDDKRDGLDWITSLPFPVQVVRAVEHRDRVSQTQTRMSFRYHHGYYDPIERELRGFGMVERLDAERDEPGATPVPRDMPPLLTKTWYHTGAWIEGERLETRFRREYFQGDPDGYRMPTSATEWGDGVVPSAAAEQQACAALAGNALRTESYGLDGSVVETVPYQVSESNYLVRMLQAPGPGRFGAFFVHEREGLDLDYERLADDPRTSHVLNLGLDAFGDVTLSCSVAYPRRPGRQDTLPEQERLRVTCDLASYIDVAGAAVRTLGLPYETQTYEIAGLSLPPGRYFSFESIDSAVRDALDGRGVTVTAELRAWQRIYYYAADGSEAKLGETGPQELLRRDEEIFVAKTTIDGVFDGVLAPADLDEMLEREGRYVFDPVSGYWWLPSLVATYADAAGFYMASGVLDPFGTTVGYTYDEAHLVVVETEQVSDGLLDQRVRVDAFDYQSMLPVKVTDINDNVTEVQIDALGKVFLTSRYGTEGDESVGFVPILGVDWPEPPNQRELLDDPYRYLGDAESFFYYDLFSWMGRVTPGDFEPLGVDVAALWEALVAAGYLTPDGAILTAFRAVGDLADLTLPASFDSIRAAVYATITAAPHGVPAHWTLLVADRYPPHLPGATPPITIDYIDGYGRTVQSKRAAGGGAAFATGVDGAVRVSSDDTPVVEDAPARWLTTGRVRYNNKGLAFRQYAPYFVDSPRYTDDSALLDTGVVTTFSFDALARLARIDLPAGYFSRFERTAWYERELDPNDTVRESEYYRAHVVDGYPVGLDTYAAEALFKSVLASGTPKTSIFDNLGRVVAIVRENNATADAAYFEPIGLSREEAEALVAFLQGAGFLDFRGALTIAFQPAQPTFDLGLPPEFEPYEPAILAALEAVQTTSVRETSHFAYDVFGDEVWAVDPRLAVAGSGVRNFDRVFALNGMALRIVGADAGVRYQLQNILGATFFERDGRGTVTRTTFDSLNRPIELRVRTSEGAEWTAQRWIYGDTLDGGESVVPDPWKYNLVDAVYRELDPSGLGEYALYAVTGGVMTLRRQIAVDYRNPIDWPSTNQGPRSPLLEPTIYETRSTFDALGRLTRSVDAGGYERRYTFQLSGAQESATLVSPDGGSAPYAGSAEYNARGQITAIALGNGVAATYEYDSLTGWLTGIRSLADGGEMRLQELTAYRDAVGNLTHVTDGAFEELFGPQSNATPGADYDYDALDRLVGARGQERSGRGANRDRQGGYDGLTAAFESGGVDPTALSTYRREFAYDSGGNLYAINHTAPANEWSGEVVVSDRSNRAVEAAVFDETASPPTFPVERVAPAAEVDAFFDGNGNQRRMLDVAEVEWDFRNQTSRVRVGEDVEEFYVYDGVGRRVRRVVVSGTDVSETLYLGEIQIDRALPEAGSPVELRRRVLASFASYFVAELTVEGEGTGVLRYQLGDPLRSVAFQLGSDGALLSYEEYVPYGGTSFAVVADAEALDGKQARYSQEPRDRATGLYYYGARYLAPWTGRWSSPDPAGPIDSLNLFSFVTGNPTTSIDVGGALQITLADGTVIDVPESEILEAIFKSADQLKAQYGQSKIASTGQARKMDLYEPKNQGDLFKLAFQGRGDPINNVNVTSYALKVGNLESTMQQGGLEPGVHLVSTIKNADYTGGEKPDYAAMKATANPVAEARRLLHLMKVKATPTGSSFNNTMVPIMAISETDRSPVGGLLAMIELYNIKYGARTFKQAFDNGNNPYFVGAKTSGGAKALKTLDRERRKLAVTAGQKLTGDQRTKLNNSLSTFVTALHSGRGGKKASKFAGVKNKTQLLQRVTDVLVKRAGVPVQQRAKRQAAVNAVRNMKGMK